MSSRTHTARIYLLATPSMLSPPRPRARRRPAVAARQPPRRLPAAAGNRASAEKLSVITLSSPSANMYVMHRQLNRKPLLTHTSAYWPSLFMQQNNQQHARTISRTQISKTVPRNLLDCHADHTFNACPPLHTCLGCTAHGLRAQLVAHQHAQKVAHNSRVLLFILGTWMNTWKLYF